MALSPGLCLPSGDITWASTVSRLWGTWSLGCITAQRAASGNCLPGADRGTPYPQGSEVRAPSPSQASRRICSHVPALTPRAPEDPHLFGDFRARSCLKALWFPLPTCRWKKLRLREDMTCTNLKGGSWPRSVGSWNRVLSITLQGNLPGVLY